MKTKRLAELSLLTAAALIIFIVELRLPNLTAIPGVKLGLANIVTVYAVYRFSTKETLLMVLTRVLLGAFFSSNFSAVIYSLAGALLCLCGMIPLKKIIPIDYIFVCSIIGALLHNTGQIVTAALMTGTTAVFGYYPHLIISGAVAGMFTGLCAKYVIKRLPEKFKRRNENEPNDFT
ncbi:MAG TPA: heptaprenyl diphosphate synthase [Ruminococcus sp.]|nr:heptaprenyl diphosphate synthase [Ruminococcus sp.]